MRRILDYGLKIFCSTGVIASAMHNRSCRQLVFVLRKFGALPHVTCFVIIRSKVLWSRIDVVCGEAVRLHGIAGENANVRTSVPDTDGHMFLLLSVFVSCLLFLGVIQIPLLSFGVFKGVSVPLNVL